MKRFAVKINDTAIPKTTESNKIGVLTIVSPTVPICPKIAVKISEMASSSSFHS